MSSTTSILLLALVGHALAYPWVADMADSSLLRRSGDGIRQAPSQCPNNPNHEGAVPHDPKFPYCGAVGAAIPAVFPCKNNRVPAEGDTAHRFIAPGPSDIRGPCPGINVAANHGFLSRDGITTFSELVEMQQNVYGLSYGASLLLGVLGVGFDGDSVTQKVSIGCDATSRTGSLPGATYGEFGLNGHNKFESDASLTRKDYFLDPEIGDNYSFNRTLYDDMINNYCKGNCDVKALSAYRKHRFETSKKENGNFVFGPLQFLLYGAASFLYELMPSGGSGVADVATMNSFFLDEKLPDNWFTRPDAYDIPKIAAQVSSLYLLNPTPLGANQGKPNTYVGAGAGGVVSDNSFGTPQGVQCALFQLATGQVPGVALQGPLMSTAAQAWALKTLLPVFTSLKEADASLSGCPIGAMGPTKPGLIG